MSFSTENGIVFHDQSSYQNDGETKIVAWLDLNKISFGNTIKHCKYALIDFTGVSDDTIIIQFYKKKKRGTLKLNRYKKYEKA